MCSADAEAGQQQMFESVCRHYRLHPSGVVYDVTNTYLYGSSCSLGRLGKRQGRSERPAPDPDRNGRHAGRRLAAVPYLQIHKRRWKTTFLLRTHLQLASEWTLRAVSTSCSEKPAQASITDMRLRILTTFPTRRRRRFKTQGWSPNEEKYSDEQS